jgi:hypothetical protein
MKNKNLIYYGIGALAIILLYNYLKNSNKLPASRINKHSGQTSWKAYM